MARREATVWYGSQRVGRLLEDGHRGIYFAYDSDWLDDGFPVSVNLPLSRGDQAMSAQAFFQGLLPEGRVRERICRQYGLDQSDDMGLLQAIGEDCAGALSIMPPGSLPDGGDEPPQVLDEAQLEQLIMSAGGDIDRIAQQQRFSLAGAQEKQPVIYDGQTYALPDRLHPSTHILKFETLPRVCFAEYMANDMARRMGLPVADTEFLSCQVDEQSAPYLQIRRYDRLSDAKGQRLRLHQEDMLQALGIPAQFKYQQQGGPDLEAVAELLRAHVARPVEAIARLRDWQILNFLIGNWDGHGKNLALLYEPGQAVPTLAPFYDLVAIEFFNRVRPGTWAREMAFWVGGAALPERVGRGDWQLLAQQLGIPFKPLMSRIEEWAGQLPGVAREAREAFAAQYDDWAVYEYLQESIQRRCDWTLNAYFQQRP